MLASKALPLALAVLVSLPAASPSAARASEGPTLAARLEAATAIEDPLQRASQRSAIFFEARDFKSTLREVAMGLQQDPDALELLWRASAAELWLGDGERALSWAERLEEAVERAEREESQRESWESAAVDFKGQAREQLELVAKGQGALSRARMAIGSVLLGALVLMGWLVRSAPRGAH